MLAPSITDWMSGIGAVLASVAAIVAAYYAKQAARETAKAAKAAADQVELQRPRPILMVTFSYSLKRNQTDEDRFKKFRLQNIGDSPAFDVKVSPIELPDGSECLKTEEISHLLGGQIHACKHQLQNNRGGLAILQPAETFASALADYFDRKSGGALDERINKGHRIYFEVSYHALDKRHFSQRYAFIVYFLKLRVWVEPVQSLLENSSLASSGNY